jgi:HEAT repeat protein
MSAKMLFPLTLVFLAANSALRATAPPQKAWDILRAGAEEKSAVKRADAIQALGLLPHDNRARTMAEKALGDDKPEVRAAAATALGDMRSRGSVRKLTEALSDKDPSVVLAAAHSLLAFRDHAAYDVYYAVLTGQRKTSRGLITEQRAMLQDPRKLAAFGVETALGFVPFAGIGLSTYKMLSKNDSAAVRAAAAQVLAKDPDPQSRNALVEAVSDRSWMVRVAALQAIAARDDPRLLSNIEPSLDDEKDAVQYTAAAAVIRLSEAMTARRQTSDKNHENK